MNRLFYLTLLGVTAAAALGCRSDGTPYSCCWSSSRAAYRGAPCNTYAPAPCACPNPCSTPVYTQSLPAYGGECGGCSSYPGYVGSPGCSSCTGGCGEMQFSPGTVIPGQGVIIGGAGQMPTLPGGALTPHTAPAPQTTPIPQATPGPAAGN